MNRSLPMLSNDARLLIMPLLAAVLISGCNANVAVVTPSPAPAANAQSSSAQGDSAASNSGQSPCVGVKDPTTNPPSGGSSKQWNAPDNVVDASHIYCAIITTEKGRIVAELYPRVAPKNVNSFVFLAGQGFYDSVTWHRVLAGFMAQTGDPTATGAGGPGYNNLPLEVNSDFNYDREGRIGMARTTDPNSAGSQFFITFAPYPSLSQQYTIIGQVVEGMNVVKQISLRDPESGPNLPPGDKLVSIRAVDLGAQK